MGGRSVSTPQPSGVTEEHQAAAAADASAAAVAAAATDKAAGIIANVDLEAE